MLMLAAVAIVSVGTLFDSDGAGPARRLQVNPPAAGTETPDFSGRWILDSASPPGPDAPRTLTVRQVRRRTNVFGDPVAPTFSDITIDREFERGSVSESLQIGIVGGSVQGFGRDGRTRGASTYHAVTWDGGALVFEAESSSGTTYHQAPWTERREVWLLDDRGRLTIAISTRGSERVPRSVTLLYQRP